MSRKKRWGIVLLSLFLVFASVSIVIGLNIYLTQNAINKTQAQQELFVIDPATVDPEDLYTFNCELSEQKPNLIFQYCADGGAYLYKIKWQKWSPYGSTGTGIYSVNMCEPNCAEGTRKEVPVTIALFDLFERKGKIYLRTLVLNTIDSKELPYGGTSKGWDLAEFAIEMKWD
jgi:hypothetical protein